MQYTLALLALLAAVEASPFAFPQAVTAVITPSAAAPPGCYPTFSAGGSFAIAVQNVSTKAAKRQVGQISDGQPQVMTMAPVSQITDGQIQGGMHTMNVMPIAQISDGQIQGATTTLAPVTEFTDGQPQAPTVVPISQISDGQHQAATATAQPVSQISDGQPQATVNPVSQISDGQPQATKSTATAVPVSQISDAQPQAPTSTAVAVSQISDAQPQASTGSVTSTAPTSTATPGTTMVACASNSTLELTLNNGILKDSHGRTGYIASNYQFQFDSPPQAGAIYTAGFSACGNNTLALGGSNIFYQCLSGNFYNLYNTNWAAQCSPVTINLLGLVNCA